MVMRTGGPVQAVRLRMRPASRRLRCRPLPGMSQLQSGAPPFHRRRRAQPPWRIFPHRHPPAPSTAAYIPQADSGYEYPSVLFCLRLRHARSTCRCRPGPTSSASGLHVRRCELVPAEWQQLSKRVRSRGITGICCAGVPDPTFTERKSVLLIIGTCSRYWHGTSFIAWSPDAWEAWQRDRIHHQGRGPDCFAQVHCFCCGRHSIGWLFASLFACDRGSMFGLSSASIFWPAIPVFIARSRTGLGCGRPVFGAQAR